MVYRNEILTSNEMKIKKLNEYLMPIKINSNKINIQDDIYSIGFCYFEVNDILKFNKPLIHKGILSKKIFLKEFYELVYQIDSSTYSGGSGCPIVDKNGFLVGFLYQNLKFDMKNSYMQVPNSGFIISKYIIIDILDEINNKNKNKNKDRDKKNPEFEKLKIFNVNKNLIDPVFNFPGFKFQPKF
jgi:hypothetical protein